MGVLERFRLWTGRFTARGSKPVALSIWVIACIYLPSHFWLLKWNTLKAKADIPFAPGVDPSTLTSKVLFKCFCVFLKVSCLLSWAMSALTMCRYTWTVCSRTFLAKFLPLDAFDSLHRWSGVIGWIELLSVFVVYMINWKLLCDYYKAGKEDWNFCKDFYSEIMITGYLLVFFHTAIIFTSIRAIRRKKYELFYWMHHLFVAILLLSVLHPMDWRHRRGGKERLQVWPVMIGPVTLYFVDRTLQALSHRHPFISRCTLLSHPKTILLKLYSPRGFDHQQPGMICWLNVQPVSWLNWHPFSIAHTDELGALHLIIHVIPNGWTDSLWKLLSFVTINVPFAAVSATRAGPKDRELELGAAQDEDELLHPFAAAGEGGGSKREFKEAAYVRARTRQFNAASEDEETSVPFRSSVCRTQLKHHEETISEGDETLTECSDNTDFSDTHLHTRTHPDTHPHSNPHTLTHTRTLLPTQPLAQRMAPSGRPPLSFPVQVDDFEPREVQPSFTQQARHKASPPLNKRYARWRSGSRDRFSSEESHEFMSAENRLMPAETGRSLAALVGSEEARRPLPTVMSQKTITPPQSFGAQTSVYLSPFSRDGTSTSFDASEEDFVAHRLSVRGEGTIDTDGYETVCADADAVATVAADATSVEDLNFKERTSPRHYRPVQQQALALSQSPLDSNVSPVVGPFVGPYADSYADPYADSHINPYDRNSLGNEQQEIAGDVVSAHRLAAETSQRAAQIGSRNSLISNPLPRASDSIKSGLDPISDRTDPASPPTPDTTAAPSAVSSPMTSPASSAGARDLRTEALEKSIGAEDVARGLVYLRKVWAAELKAAGYSKSIAISNLSQTVANTASPTQVPKTSPESAGIVIKSEFDRNLWKDFGLKNLQAVLGWDGSIGVSGPFTAGVPHAANFEHSIMIGAGSGVVPCLSHLQKFLDATAEVLAERDARRGGRRGARKASKRRRFFSHALTMRSKGASNARRASRARHSRAEGNGGGGILVGNVVGSKGTSYFRSRPPTRMGSQIGSVDRGADKENEGEIEREKERNRGREKRVNEVRESIAQKRRSAPWNQRCRRWLENSPEWAFLYYVYILVEFTQGVGALGLAVNHSLEALPEAHFAFSALRCICLLVFTLHKAVVTTAFGVIPRSKVRDKESGKPQKREKQEVPSSRKNMASKRLLRWRQAQSIFDWVLLILSYLFIILNWTGASETRDESTGQLLERLRGYDLPGGLVSLLTWDYYCHITTVGGYFCKLKRIYGPHLALPTVVFLGLFLCSIFRMLRVWAQTPLLLNSDIHNVNLLNREAWAKEIGQRGQAVQSLDLIWVCRNPLWLTFLKDELLLKCAPIAQPESDLDLDQDSEVDESLSSNLQDDDDSEKNDGNDSGKDLSLGIANRRRPKTGLERLLALPNFSIKIFVTSPEISPDDLPALGIDDEVFLSLCHFGRPALETEISNILEKYRKGIAKGEKSAVFCAGPESFQNSCRTLTKKLADELATAFGPAAQLQFNAEKFA